MAEATAALFRAGSDQLNGEVRSFRERACAARGSEGVAWLVNRLVPKLVAYYSSRPQ